jgi:flagellar basal-body rod modification protein FlgD
MSSIGTTLPTTQSTLSQSTAGQSAATDGANSLASQQTFLQLLVAQLQNQDPTQPMQGTEFVTQLATFSDVEQNLAVRQDVDAISNKFLGSVPSGGTVTTPATAASGTPSTGGPTTNGTTASSTVSGG